MSGTFEYDVFLSYSSKDKEIVHALAERMKTDELRVWLDTWAIQPGDSIPIKIQQGLEKSRTLLMCMSSAYFESEWGKLEHYTLLFSDPTNAQRRFIPLLIKDCTLPDIIAQFAHIDWRAPSDEAYNKLVAACRGGEKEKDDSAPMVLKGHNRKIWGVAVTPDGKTIVSGSDDNTLKVWDIKTGRCRATFDGHFEQIRCVSITLDGKKVVSGSNDNTMRVWDLETGQCLSTLIGHTGLIRDLAITPDGKTVVSGSNDNTLKVWDLRTNQCRSTLKGHSGQVRCVAITPDGKTVVSGSEDQRLNVWDLESGECRITLKDNTGDIYGIVITPDGQTIVSGSKTMLKLWDLTTGQCRAIFEGHTSDVWDVAVTPDSKSVVSSSSDRTLKVWDLETGQCRSTLKGHFGQVRDIAITSDGKTVVSVSYDKTLRVWELPQPEMGIETAAARYTNAKVVLVGKTGVGKTGLALRLCEGRWEVTDSTHGMIVSQLELPPGRELAGMEREVWLWDFAGQPDYRLVHQLYMEETALGVLVFDPQDDNPFEEIGYWEKALRSADKHQPTKLLVAARCDRGGITISRRRFDQYVREHNIADFLSTGAKTGDGCEGLKAAIARHIPWERLPWTATSQLFKTLKDAIINLTKEDTPLVRLPELNQRLQLLLPEEIINEAELRAVVGLMQGQGVVKMLAFGDFVLLRPEWVNRYASVVVRMAREHADEMGVVQEKQVLEGCLDYKDMKRLAKADEEILLRAMVQTFLDRSLCLREETPQGTMLVFPSYFSRDKPDLPEHPNVFVTYSFAGPLEEIYATLVVRLNYSDGFDSEQLWKNAADFKTSGGKRVGLAMTKKPEGAAEIKVYFETGVPDDTKVAFIKYVHEHLLGRAQDVKRVRHYICPNPRCGEPVESIRAVVKAMERGAKSIPCQFCSKSIPIFDLIEQKFASSKALAEVQKLDERAKVNLDNESRELILVGHAAAIAAEAGQIFRHLASSNYGIDGEIEFKNDTGQASGVHVYVQLKSDDSYNYQRGYQRGVNDREMFTIKNPRHAEYWLSLPYPVMLVIRTSDDKIRWMNVTDYLRLHGTTTKQIIFEGEPFTAPNVARLRDKMLHQSRGN